MEEYYIRFIKWAKLKIRIHISEGEPVYFKEKEIWWTSLGINVGHEQDGKNESFERPVLILKKFNEYILWILPLTSQDKTGKYYYQFEYEEKKYSVLLSQIRTISSKRLLRKVRIFSEDDFNNVREKIKEII